MLLLSVKTDERVVLAQLLHHRIVVVLVWVELADLLKGIRITVEGDEFGYQPRELMKYID